MRIFRKVLIGFLSILLMYIFSGVFIERAAIVEHQEKMTMLARIAVSDACTNQQTTKWTSYDFAQPNMSTGAEWKYYYETLKEDLSDTYIGNVLTYIQSQIDNKEDPYSPLQFGVTYLSSTKFVNQFSDTLDKLVTLNYPSKDGEYGLLDGIFIKGIYIVPYDSQKVEREDLTGLKNLYMSNTYIVENANLLEPQISGLSDADSYQQIFGTDINQDIVSGINTELVTYKFKVVIDWGYITKSTTFRFFGGGLFHLTINDIKQDNHGVKGVDFDGDGFNDLVYTSSGGYQLVYPCITEIPYIYTYTN